MDRLLRLGFPAFKDGDGVLAVDPQPSEDGRRAGHPMLGPRSARAGDQAADRYVAS
jgi:hypothetical protein